MWTIDMRISCCLMLVLSRFPEFGTWVTAFAEPSSTSRFLCRQLVFMEHKAWRERSASGVVQPVLVVITYPIRDELRLRAMGNWKSVEARSYSSVIDILLEGRVLIPFQVRLLKKGKVKRHPAPWAAIEFSLLNQLQWRRTEKSEKKASPG